MGTEWQRYLCQFPFCIGDYSSDNDWHRLKIYWSCKNYNKKYPMKYLSSLDLTEERGQRTRVITNSLGVPWIKWTLYG